MKILQAISLFATTVCNNKLLLQGQQVRWWCKSRKSLQQMIIADLVHVTSETTFY